MHVHVSRRYQNTVVGRAVRDAYHGRVQRGEEPRKPFVRNVTLFVGVADPLQRRYTGDGEPAEHAPDGKL